MPLDEIVGCVENRLLLVFGHQEVEQPGRFIGRLRRRLRLPSSVYVCATGVFQDRLVGTLRESSVHH